MEKILQGRAAVFEAFCNEWIASSAYLELMARCILERKDVEIVFPDGRRRSYRVTDYLIASITGEPHEHDVLAPYSLDAYERGYQALVGTLTLEEEKRFFEAWTMEDEAWVHFTDAIANAFPSMANASQRALSDYWRLRDYAVAFYRGEYADATIANITELSFPLERYLAEFLSLEIDHRQLAKNVKKLVVKL